MTNFGSFGDNQTARLFHLENANGIRMSVTDLGAIITELHVPDRNGHFGDIVLGYDTPEAYFQDSAHMGAVAGRFAGRIAQGKCRLKGRQIELGRNHGDHHLHGGWQGFNKKLWRGEITNRAICFHLTSPDGDEGYPGALDVTVEYCLTDDDSLHISYGATASKTTLVNLTQHSYFNLSGQASAVDDHMLTLYADQVLDIDEDMIPTGKILDVQDTPLDFRTGKRLAEDYDHSYILGDILAHRQTEQPQMAASLTHPPSGRRMDIYTDRPALHLYTANNLTADITGKGAVAYGAHQAVCLESQNFPDAPNHSHFPSAILEAGDIFHSQTIFRFGCTPPLSKDHHAKNS